MNEPFRLKRTVYNDWSTSEKVPKKQKTEHYSTSAKEEKNKKESQNSKVSYFEHVGQESKIYFWCSLVVSAYISSNKIKNLRYIVFVLFTIPVI